MYKNTSFQNQKSKISEERAPPPPTDDVRRRAQCEGRLTVDWLRGVCIVKAVIAVALALVLYVGSRSLVEALDAGLLTRVDVLRVYVDAVGIRVNQTNRYISDDAVYLNDIARAVYGDQMRSELLNLQALVDFFNAG